MHYYKKNLGDYYKKAGRLTMLQHGSYTLLIDSCYDRERFPTREEAIDWCWASSKEEIEAVEFILRKFFVLEDGVYIQNRIQVEVDKYHKNAGTNKRIAIEREAKRKESSTDREPSVNEPPPNQEPITKNQEPDIKDTSTKLPNCPYGSIENLYREILVTAGLNDTRDNKDWSKARKSKVQARWRAKPDLDHYKRMFEFIRDSNPFLMGKAPANQGRAFKADLDWIFTESNYQKIIERKYES